MAAGHVSQVSESVSDFFEDKDHSSIDAIQDLEAKGAHLYSYEARVKPSKEPGSGIAAAFLSSVGYRDKSHRTRYWTWAFSPQVVVTRIALTPSQVTDQQSLGSVFVAALASSEGREEEIAPNVSHHVRLPPKDRKKVEVEITRVRKGKPQRVRPRDLLLEEGQRAHDALPAMSHHVRLPPKDRKKVEVEITRVRKGKPQRVRPRDLV
jgi:hypothetical protein